MRGNPPAALGVGDRLVSERSETGILIRILVDGDVTPGAPPIKVLVQGWVRHVFRTALDT